MRMHTALLAFFLFFPRPASATEESFSSYVRQYNAPEFFSSNEPALDARLKLIDMAPKGAHIRLATYAFKNGESTRRLSRHLCLAAGRGVKVEFLIDSRSGARYGDEKSSGKGGNSQVVEELLQYLANCHVEVTVHNQLHSYVEILGARVPNFFLDPKMEHRQLNAFHVVKIYRRVRFLMDRFSRIAESEFAKAGVEASPRPVLKALRAFVFYFLLGMRDDEDNNPNGTALRRHYDRMILDPIWDKVSPQKLREILLKIEARFQADPVFRPLAVELRRFNRISHRKLFVVEHQGEGCMILGGRNLGDHYFLEEKGAFMDGDVLTCRHHGGGIESAMNDAVASFEELKSERSDPYVGRVDDNRIGRVRPHLEYEFRALRFPRGLKPFRAVVGKYRGKLDDGERSLLPEKKWSDALAVHGELSLPSAEGWQVFTSGWNPAEDNVRRHLLGLIEEEKKEIYIETPYAEFDASLRSAIEGALRRGVHVKLTTNSFFTLDGKSPVIRLLMAHWTEKTLAKYNNFEVRFTELNGGRMLHFKGAAFACQPGGWRAYLVGSHNFHPRSGNSDKEHAITWKERTDCAGGLASTSLVAERERYFGDRSRALRNPVLDRYPNLFNELRVVKKASRSGEMAKHRLAEALLEMFYEKIGPHTWEPRHGARMKKIFDTLDESGLHDLLGRVF